MNDKQEQLIKKINSYLSKEKHFNSFLSIRLFNKSPYNFYITCGTNKKNDLLKLYWIDLDAYNTCGIDCLNEETLFGEFYSKLELFILNAKIDSFEEYEKLYPDYTCMDIKVNNKDYSFKFSRYIPKSKRVIVDIFAYVFDFLPMIIQKFLEEMIEDLAGVRRDYLRCYNFDLMKDDLSMIFNDKIIERGIFYYKNNYVKFLEKIGDLYYAVVTGDKDYLIVLGTNQDKTVLSFTCSCPCEFACKHVVSVILAIRENKYNPFYKLTYNNDKRSLLNRILNKNFILCLDVVDDNYVIVDESTRTITTLPTSTNVSIFEDHNDYIKNKIAH